MDGANGGEAKCIDATTFLIRNRKTQKSRLVVARCIRAERFVLVIEVPGRSSKVAQIFFLKDGSLCVAFPYYRSCDGIVSVPELPANGRYPMDLSLALRGKVTSHLVKYSHHPDGLTLFSQDGKVLSKIRKQSVPLAQVRDHIFTVQLQGLGDFEKTDPARDTGVLNPKRTVLTFRYPALTSNAFKLVGRWYPQKEMAARYDSRWEGDPGFPD